MQIYDRLTEKDKRDQQADEDNEEERVLEDDPAALALLLRREQRGPDLLGWAQPDCIAKQSVSERASEQR